MDSNRITPLHLVSFAIISSSSNSPLYIHSFTGEEDKLRYWQLAHAALDIVEEREALTNRPPENFLGLLYAMDDVAVYGYRTATNLRIIVTLELIDGVIKDSDVVTICRAIHQLFSTTTSNPFLPHSQRTQTQSQTKFSSTNIFEPQQIPYSEYSKSEKLRIGAESLGKLLNGGGGKGR